MAFIVGGFQRLADKHLKELIHTLPIHCMILSDNCESYFSSSTKEWTHLVFLYLILFSYLRGIMVLTRHVFVLSVNYES